MRHLALRAIVLALFLGLVPAAFADCTSHFYNHTEFPWTISGQDAGNTQLVIPAKTATEFHWSTLATSVVISATIHDHLYTMQFLVHRMAGCYVIVQRGNPGPLLLNRPSQGDISACVGRCSS